MPRSLGVDGAARASSPSATGSASGSAAGPVIGDQPHDPVALERDQHPVASVAGLVQRRRPGGRAAAPRPRPRRAIASVGTRSPYELRPGPQLHRARPTAASSAQARGRRRRRRASSCAPSCQPSRGATLTGAGDQANAGPGRLAPTSAGSPTSGGQSSSMTVAARRRRAACATGSRAGRREPAAPYDRVVAGCRATTGTPTALADGSRRRRWRPRPWRELRRHR